VFKGGNVTEADRTRRSRKIAGLVALGGSAAAGGLWVLQHRSAARAVATEEEIAEEGLSLPLELTEHFVEADDGARIRVVEGGSGPALVLLHGFMLDSSIWAHQFRDLCDSHRVIAVDQRGHGRSEVGKGFGASSRAGGSAWESFEAAAPMAEAGTGAPAIRCLASDLGRVLESLDVTDALLVGHSMGGMVALQFVADHSDAASRVSSLVLASTSAGPFFELPGWPRFARLAAPASARAVHVADRVGVKVLPTEDLRYWVSRLGFGADASSAQVRFLEAIHVATPARTLAGLLPSIALFDLSAELGSLELPALVVVGTHDHLTPPRHARRMAQALPRSELVELARCGHMPMMERPHEFSHLLEEFCAFGKTSSRHIGGDSPHARRSLGWANKTRRLKRQR
jgi:pimeloyl-ACP methyl ester carboxylesterase